MAFGQSSGPPATGQQIRSLLELLEAAGHSDFRDARGPMGFTQRQAGGKFTRDEADAFIEQLESEIHGDGPPEDSRPPAAPAAPASKIVPRQQQRAQPAKAKQAAKPATKTAKATVDLSDVSVEALAAELQSRGWVVLEP
jgi:hypothetical protein